MLRLSPAQAAEPPFSADDVLNGVIPDDCQGPDRIRVLVEGRDDYLRFYGAQAGPADRPPLIFLEGDVVRVAQPRTEPPVWHIGKS